MKRRTQSALVVAMCCILGACASSTNLVQRWSDPTFAGRPGQKMVVVALAQNERNQRTWEQAFSAGLSSVNVTSIAGSSLIPWGSAADSMTYRQKIKDSGADLVAVTKLVRMEKEQEYVPGSTTYYPSGPAYGYYGYYYNSWSAVTTPGYIQTNMIYELETNVYDIAAEKLIWSGLTHTVNPETTQSAANSITQTVIDDLIASKVIQKK